MELLDSAIVDLQKVKSVAQGVTGDECGRSRRPAMAAQVGIARAHLQAGRAGEASAAAAQVPESFAYYLLHLDDSSNRSLGNPVWGFSEARISLVVPPAFRAMADAGDPRIAYVDMGRVAQDGVLEFNRQDKYKGWGDSRTVRLRSRGPVHQGRSGPESGGHARVHQRAPGRGQPG